MLLPPDASWTAFWNTDKTKPHELYIDIIKLIKADSDEIRMIDLDLDVARTWNGDVAVLDRDEFELHQKVLQYPKDVIELAKRTTESLEERVRSRREPFGAVGDSWRNRALQ
jgi:protein associated with RNAse G/E